MEFVVFAPRLGHYVVTADTWIRAIQSVIARTDTVARDWQAHQLSGYPQHLQARLRAESK